MKKVILTYVMLLSAFIGFSQCQASFTTSTNGNMASFTNNSIGSNLGYNWSFGDGNNSSQTNPSHTYSTSGSYLVCLTIWSNDSLSQCQDTYCDTIFVQDTTGGGGGGPCSISANVSGAGSTIIGTNTSTGASTFDWLVYDAGWNYLYSTNTTNLSYSPGSTGWFNVCLAGYADSTQQFCDSVCYQVYLQDSTGGGGGGPCNISANVQGYASTIFGTNTSSGATGYYWTIYDSGFNLLTTEYTYNLTYPAAPGSYLVCLGGYADSTQMPCDSVCYQIFVTQDSIPDSTAGVFDLEALNYQLYPNPANDVVTILLDDQINGQIVLTDLAGRRVREITIKSKETTINVADMPRGTYLIQLLDPAGVRLLTDRIQKQ